MCRNRNKRQPRTASAVLIGIPGLEIGAWDADTGEEAVSGAHSVRRALLMNCFRLLYGLFVDV